MKLLSYGHFGALLSGNVGNMVEGWYSPPRRYRNVVQIFTMSLPVQAWGG